MQRKYISDLHSWFINKDRKPLLIYGARQIGKTYLIKEIFAKQYFKDRYKYFDLNKDRKIRDFIKDHVGAQDIINFIKAEYGFNVNKETLLIFDEAQACLPIITAMKYFCQDAREVPVIVTGSMVRIKIQREHFKQGPNNNFDLLFPIGKIDSLNMYQLNFEEYLMNRNDFLYRLIKDSYNERKPLENSYHTMALDVLYEYLMIGGMPEAVDTYLQKQDIIETKNKIVEIYNNYIGDMGLFQASDKSTVKTVAIYNSIFNQLNKEQKNFKCSLIGDDLRNRDLRGPIEWLNLANVVYKSNQLKEYVTTPLIAPLDSLYRLYLSDMGLFTYQSKVNYSPIIDSNSQNTLAGIFFENYVAIELVNAGFNLFYWRGKARAELEFIINNYQDLIVIDAKKSRGSVNSIQEFRHHNKNCLCVKVSKNNYGYDPQQNILTVPFYMFFLLVNDIKEHKKII